MNTIADRLALLKFNSCTCLDLRGYGQHEPRCPTGIIHDACVSLRTLSVRIEALERDNAELRKALRASRCPRPMEGSYPCTVGGCFNSGNCGCDARTALHEGGGE